ncbi:hypothetical protein HMSSN139_01190 [Paenibacillus sp. HMSSN-139]|nr:hypothetical protein HMSSN139_01190 [Paenibacillus sp. HMSSN-139]
MKEQLARTIIRYRKEKGWTQDELAQKLGLSFQAVSKWENAQTMPDITLLPPLAGILGVTVDKLLGYAAQAESVTIYEEQYRIPEYYWGTEPNSSCYQILQWMPPTRPLKVLDIGCGEGKDAVFLARNGYEVTAFDVTDAGIEKTKRLADRAGVHVNVFKADIRDFRLDTEFDILHSSGVLHYLRRRRGRMYSRVISVLPGMEVCTCLTCSCKTFHCPAAGEGTFRLPLAFRRASRVIPRLADPGQRGGRVRLQLLRHPPSARDGKIAAQKVVD